MEGTERWEEKGKKTKQNQSGKPKKFLERKKVWMVDRESAKDYFTQSNRSFTALETSAWQRGGEREGEGDRQK
jgi:transposase